MHNKKRRKNLVVLGLIMGWCVLIWAVSVVRIAQGAEPPVDTSKAFIQGRTQHQARTEVIGSAWHEIYAKGDATREKNKAIRDGNREVHLHYNQKAEEIWHKKWSVLDPLRRIFDLAAEQKRAAHLQKMIDNEKKWHAIAPENKGTDTPPP